MTDCVNIVHTGYIEVLSVSIKTSTILYLTLIQSILPIGRMNTLDYVGSQGVPSGTKVYVEYLKKSGAQSHGTTLNI